MYQPKSSTVTPDVREPIAIVGMACRFPGGVANLDDFWSLMADGRDGIVDIPADRLDLEKFYDARADAPGKIYVRRGGFLQQPLDAFDAEYFGMSPREAAYLDPQQRLLLEVAYEALEDAGIPLERISGSNAGVFVGGFMVDGMLTQFSPLSRGDIGQHTAVSSTLTILSNRLSYLLDLHGPSFTLDTACSSSLVAMHQACQAIRHGECDQALVGGVNVIFRPETLIAMCKGGFLSRDGRSKSFDARADGYGRGEGAGVVVLKRLSAAQADGDRIHAVIRGTGVNQDGRTDGITVPNGTAQAQLIADVCTRNDIDPASVTYVEAHGTGTAIGDPTELGALGLALGQRREAGQPRCLVGSVKANIGHLEAAAGIAAVIKTALCLEKGQVPPVANLGEVNPALRLDAWNLDLPRTLTPLPDGQGGHAGRAAINSFGYGGTNASLVMEPAPLPAAEAPETAPETAPDLLLLSARSAEALRDLAQACLARLEGLDAAGFGDLCYSAAARRTSYEYRLAVIADGPAAAAEAVADFLQGRENPRVVQGYAGRTGVEPVFVFTGMGPQWWGMGRELMAAEPVFRAFAEEVDAIFRPLAGWSIIEEMGRPEAQSRVARTEVAQPANFVVQAGLVRLLESRGVRAAAMVGHSVGEVSSAYSAGVLSLADAVRVSYLRSKLQATTAGTGGMLAVGLGVQAVMPYLDGYLDKVSVAAVNGPATITLAGDRDALDEIAEALTDAGVFNRALQVETAYHSQIMDPLLDPLEQGLAGLAPQPARVPLYSTVTGLPVAGDDFGAAYWRRNVRDPVLFADTIRELIDDGHDCFLEIGPHPVLTGALRECLLDANVEGTMAATLRRNQPEAETLLRGIAALHVAGAAIDWQAFHAGRGRRFTGLPSYPWQRRAYWNESRSAREDRLGTAEDATLLGKPMALPDPAWMARFNRNRLDYVLDHRVEGSVVLPGAAYVEIALELAAALTGALTGQGSLRLSDLAFRQALLVGETDEIDLLTRYDETSRGFSIHSAAASHEGGWTRHAEGRVSALSGPAPRPVDVAALAQGFVRRVPQPDHYAAMTARGLQYGPMFQGVSSLALSQDGRQVLARIEAPSGLRMRDELLHPALLDACFQALIATLPGDSAAAAYVPVSIDEIRVHQPAGNRFWCHGTRLAHDGLHMVGDLRILAEDGTVLAELRGIRAQSLGAAAAAGEDDADRLLARFELVPQALSDGAAADGAAPVAPLVLLMDAEGRGAALADQLAGDGHAVRRVDPAGAQAGDLAGLLAGQDDAHVVDLRGLAADGDDAVGLSGAQDTLAALQAIPQDGRRRRFTLVVPHAGDDPASAALHGAARLGLTRVAANEYADLDIRMIQIDDAAAQAGALARELLSPGPEDDIVLTADRRLVRRLMPVTAATLDAEVKARRASGPVPEGEVEVEVIAALPNGQRHDVLAQLVADGPGTDRDRRVLLRTRAGTLPRYLRVPERSLLALADTGGLDDAGQLSLLPLALARAALDRAGLSAGQTVLLYLSDPAASAAAAAVAELAGASVTVLDKADPLGGLERLRAASPRGIDLLLTDRADEIAEAAAASVVPYGTVVLATAQAAALPPGAGRSDIHSDPDGLADDAALRLRRPLDALLAEPALSKAVTAVTAAQGAPQRLVHGQTDPAAAVAALAASVPAAAILGQGAYLVTGGFGGFGFEIARWLADRGAGRLVLVGRQGADAPGAAAMIADLEARGARVTGIAADIGDAAAVEAAVARIAALDLPLRGVFHAAGILDDAPVYSLSADQVARVMRPKAVGAWNLHRATEGLALDAFVMISSIASLLGSPGQGSYVAANSVLDAIAQHRRARGLAGLALNLGALAEVGMAARHEGVERHFARVGVGSLKPAEAIGMLDRIVAWNPVNMAAAPMDWALWGGTYAKWAASPRYAHLMPDRAADEAAGETSFAAMTAEDRAALVQRTMTELVSSVLRLPADGIDANRTLLNMGVDSLMAMELQAGLDRRLGIKVPTLELMKGVSFASLIRNLSAIFETAQAEGRQDATARDRAPAGQPATGGPGAQPAPAAATAADAGELLSQLDSMSAEDIETALKALGNL